MRQPLRRTHALGGVNGSVGEALQETEGVGDNHTLHAARRSTVTFMRKAG